MVVYYLSGAVEARVDGVVVPLCGLKQRCVLAVLLANHGAVVSLDRLIDEVWGEAAPGKALASLRAYVANLRRILTPPTGSPQPTTLRLESRPHGYQLNLLADDRIDLHSFEELVKGGRAALVRTDAAEAVRMLDSALALWRGDPFGEFTDCGFAHTDTLRYAALRNTAIEARFDAALQLGLDADLIPEIEAAVAQDPLQERLWGHLMVALFRTGRGADAILAFERACAVLDREAGIRPGEWLQTLRRKVGDRSADLLSDRWTPQPILEPANVGPAVPQFVGRVSELEAMASSVNRAGQGSGAMILVTGESGIGKTALSHVICESAARLGMAVAWASHPTDIRMPVMWTWIQTLRQLGNSLGPASRRAVRRVAPGAVDALVPEWNTGDAVDSSGRGAVTGFDLEQGIVAALCELSSLRPLFLVLDDLHLSDPASVSALIMLAGQVARLPIHIIGTWTYFGQERPMNRQSLQRLVRSCDTTTIRLRGLDRDAAEQLVGGLAEAPLAGGAVNELLSRAGGNPLYIKELARLHDASDQLRSTVAPRVDGISDTITAVVGQRLGTLDRNCRRALAAGAVMGPLFDVAALADIVDLPVSTVQSRLHSAYEVGLLDEDSDRPDAYRFSHGLLRDAVLAQIPAAERRMIHGAIAASRAGELKTAAYEDIIAAAEHAWRAGTGLHRETALEIHESVIERAITRSAYEDVTVLAEHALHICGALPPKPEHLERQAGLWLHLAGARAITDGQSSNPAADALQRAFEVGEEARGRHFYGAVALQCQMLCGQGRIDEAEALAGGLADQHASSPDPDLGLATHFVQVMIHGLRGRFDAQIAAAKRMIAAYPVPDTVADPLQFFHPRVHCWIAIGEAIRGDREAAQNACRTALNLAQTRRDGFNVLVAKLTMVQVDAVVGIVDGTAAAAEAIFQELTAAGSPQWAACARMIATWAQTLTTTDGCDATAAFEAFDAYTHDGSTVMTPFYLALLADIETHHDHLVHARALLVRARAIIRASGERAWDEFVAGRLAALPPDEPSWR